MERWPGAGARNIQEVERGRLVQLGKEKAKNRQYHCPDERVKEI